MKKIILIILISLIKLYKFTISPLLGNNCRFLPTCSDYFIESLECHGVIEGFILGCKRIIRCHPIKFLGAEHGYDPVRRKRK